MFRIKEAAELLGVSDDTVRRWADAGRITTSTDDSGRQVIDGAQLARFAEELAEPAGALLARSSLRSRSATGSPAWSRASCGTRSWRRWRSRPGRIGSSRC